MSALVYSYHCDSPMEGLPYAEDEYERVTLLWDTLVEIDRATERERYRLAAAAVPEIAALMRCIEAASCGLDALRTAGTARKDPVFEAAIVARRALYAERNAAYKLWRKTPPAKAALRIVELDRQAQIKKARQESDLWWPNYNRTIAAYEVARQVCAQTGRRLRLHYPERDDGVLAVQIQRTKSGLGAAPSEIEDGSASQLQIGRIDPRAYDPETPATVRRSLRRSTVEMRVDPNGNTILLPITMHRPLPPDSRIKAAQLTWRKQGNKLRWQLALTVAMPALRLGSGDEDVWQTEGSLALHWSEQDDGSLLVATCGEHRCVLDAQWMRQMNRVRGLQALLDAPDDDPRWIVYADQVRAARPHKRSLVEIAKAEHDGLAVRLLRRRREIYRLWAREIVRAYSTIVVDDVNLARVAIEERTTGPNSLRVRAAPHILRDEITHQAAKVDCTIRRAGASAPVAQAPTHGRSDAWARRKAAAAERSRILRAEAATGGSAP